MSKASSNNSTIRAMRVLITGGAGFIGTYLAHRLHRDGHSIIVLDSLLPQVHGQEPKLDLPDCETIWADVRDVEKVTEAMKGVDVVHHFAAETGVGQSQYEIGRYVSTNTYGTAVVLEAAVAAGVRQVVIASSRAVYGEGQYHCPSCGRTFVADARRAEDMDRGIWEILCPKCGQPAQVLPMTEDAPPAPTSIYGITKHQQEQLARTVSHAHNLPVTILRFFNVYGPGQSLRNPYVGVLGTFFRRALAGQPLEVYEDGRMLRDFVFVEDVAEALRLCTGDEQAYGQILNVGYGHAVTLMEVAEELFRALNLEARLQVSGRYRLGDIRHAVADSSRLESVTGFRPQVSFAEGLRRYLEWALKHQVETEDVQAEKQLATHNLLRQGKR